ncbi:hypothetical protein [Arthrobacter sp. RAF14]|uniref:hypothetical protein n=1 Tax=Arthrobacter sp. RAF14 TaxID=3233051 RepID=UPI003F92AAA9
MSGRRVAPPPARTARGRSRSRSRGARRADSGALAAWGVATPASRQAVSLATLSAVLLVSTALVSGGTPQPQLAAGSSAVPRAESKAPASGAPGVALSRPSDRSSTAPTAPSPSRPTAKSAPANDASRAGAIRPVDGPAGAGVGQGHLTAQSSGAGISGEGASGEGASGGGAPVTGQPGVADPTAPAPGSGENGTPSGGQPGDGGAGSPAPVVPGQPQPSTPANPSTPAPTVPPVAPPPAPKPPAPQPIPPAPKPPENSGCVVNILGITICLPLLGG